MASEIFGPSLRKATSQTPGRNLHEMVVNRLGLMIARGDLSVGDQILPETVGTELGASRVVIREALRVLEAKGMVHPRPKVGTRVLPPEQWDLLDEDVIRWRVRGPDRVRQLVELMELRIAVEVSAARASCKHATTAQIAALGAAWAEMRDAAVEGDLSEFTRADISFHHQLLTCSGNLVFAQFQTPFAALLLAREELHTLPEHISDDAVAQHAEVLQAITSKEPDAAASAARSLIEASQVELLAALHAEDAGAD